MNNINFGRLFIFSACLLAANSLRAEPPLIRMPSSGSWTIEVQPVVASASAKKESKKAKDGAGQESDPMVRSIHVVVQQGLRNDVIHWNNGLISELWRIDGKWVGKMPRGDLVVLEAIQSFFSTFGSPFGSWKAFEEKELATYTVNASIREVDYKGTPILLYESKREGERPIASPTALLDDPVQADPVTYPTALWVDKESLLPLAVKDGKWVYLFRFSNQVPKLPELPAKFVQELKEYKTRSRVPPVEIRVAPTE